MEDKSINFEVLGKSVLVEIPVIEEKTKAGIIKSTELLEQEKKELDRFLPVIAVGKEVKYLKPGDKVYLVGFNFTEVQIDGKSYVIVDESIVLGKRIYTDSPEKPLQ